jgi:hypothetical protein
MPNAAGFRSLADQFDQLASTTHSSLSSVEANWGPAVVSGGRLAATVERTLDASRSNVSGVEARLRSMATECRFRAARCEAFANEMQAWRAASASHAAALSSYSAASAARAAAPLEQQATMAVPLHPGSAPPPPVPGDTWVEE